MTESKISLLLICGFSFLTLALFVIFLFSVYYTAMLPTVHISYSTLECAFVDDLTGAASCENLPTKYHHRWVK